MYKTRFFQERVFQLTIVATIQFVLLTTLAMFFYPGGSMLDEYGQGYSFSANFFSELGMTKVVDGRSNIVSAILFFIALTIAGVGLILFFIAFKQFFNSSKASHLFSGLGTCSGIWSGIAFVGIAFTPTNLNVERHSHFVYWAFAMLPLAVIFYIITIFIEPRYPNKYVTVFCIFAVLLVIYFRLLINGPEMIETAQGVRIQAIGQKIIAYAGVISILIQSYHALAVNHADTAMSK